MRWGNYSQAEDAFHKRLKFAEEMVAANPTEPIWRFRALSTLKDLALLQVDLGTPEKELGLCERGASLAADYAKRFSDEWEFELERINFLNDMGLYQNNEGADFKEGLPIFLQAVPIVEKLLEGHSDSVDVLKEAFWTYAGMGDCYRLWGSS